jgi:hypothetical protein
MQRSRSGHDRLAGARVLTRQSVQVSQGTGTGRGIIAGISLQAISHISPTMMAGSQNSIGMVYLLCGLILQRAPAFQMPTVTSTFVIAGLGAAHVAACVSPGPQTSEA